MHSFAWWPTVIVLGVATFTDLKSRRIPNWLVLPFLVVGIVTSGYLHGWHGIGQSVAGIAVGALIFGSFFLLGGMGAGDVKLCAAIGAWIGPDQLFLALVFTGLAGGVMVLLSSAIRGQMTDLFRETSTLLFASRERRTLNHLAAAQGNRSSGTIPYGPAIAVGTLISFFAR